MQTTIHIRLLIEAENGASGSSVYNRELAGRLALAGHSVEVICESPLRPTHSEYKKHVLSNIRPRPVLWHFESIFNELYMFRQMKKLNLEKPDIVIGFSHLLLRGHARLFPNVPWVYFPHALDIETEFGPYNVLSLREKISKWHRINIQSWALKQSTKVVRFSNMAVDFIHDTYAGSNENKSKYIVNYPGVTNNAISSKTEREKTEIRFLMVGSLIRRKRVDEALRALSSITSTADWHLDIVGDGPEKEYLERIINEHNLHEKVTFLGRIDDISDAYSRSDLLLLPSRSEGFGLVIIEAMSNGVPVLAYSNVAPDTFVVTDELIQHGENGYLAKDFQTFTAIIHDMIERPENVRNLSDTTKKMARKKYNWSAHIELYERVFDEIKNNS